MCTTLLLNEYLKGAQDCVVMSRRDYTSERDEQQKKREMNSRRMREMQVKTRQMACKRRISRGPNLMRTSRKDFVQMHCLHSKPRLATTACDEFRTEMLTMLLLKAPEQKRVRLAR